MEKMNWRGDFLKDWIKVIFIMVVGILIVVFVYPALHELGHMMSAVVCGGEIRELHIFPSAYVVCNTVDMGDAGKIGVGLSGMMLPFLLTLMMQPKKFWPWYACFILRGVCILSFLISLAAVVMFRLEREIPNEDMTQVLQVQPIYGNAYFIGLIILLLLELYLVVKSRPIKQCLKYFELNKESE